MHKETDMQRKTAEAVIRMRKIGMDDKIIDDFRSGVISESEGIGQTASPKLDVIVRPVSGLEMKLIRNFECVNNAVVYHVIETWKPYLGIMRAYLFVSDSPEEWENENAALVNGEATAYVRNLSCSEISDFGLIGFEKQPGGGLLRVW